MASRRVAAAGFVIVASSAFAAASPLARAARPADPLFVAAMRVLIASVVLALVSPRGFVRDVSALSWRTLGKIFVIGAVLGAHFALYLAGLDRTSLPAAVSMVSLEPLSVVLWAWLMFRERPSRGELLGVLLATAGALVVGQAAGQGDHRLSGDLLVVGAVVLFGLYVAGARFLKDALPPRSYAALVYAFAAISLLVVLPILPQAEGVTRSPPQKSWLAILGLALIPTVIGHTSVQTAARTLSPATVALACPAETLGGIVLGAALLDAVPKPLELLGAAIIVLGSLIAIFAIKPRTVVEADNVHRVGGDDRDIATAERIAGRSPVD